MAMTASTATQRGYGHGIDIAKGFWTLPSQIAIEDDVKDDAGCECARGIVVVFCERCVLRELNHCEANSRQTSDFVAMANDINDNEDPETVWDAFDQGVQVAFERSIKRFLAPELDLRMRVVEGRLKRADAMPVVRRRRRR